MALKLRCYKAVAAGHAFYVPPPLVMPNKAQLSRLRVLRALKLFTGVGAVGMVSINAILAYRQGVQTFEEQVLEGSININMGTRSPYIVRPTSVTGGDYASNSKSKKSLVLRYGNMRDVTAMLQSPRGSTCGNAKYMALPVLLRGKENSHSGNKRALHLAVRNASKGLNDGCYILQDLLPILPTLPGEGSRIIVQAGGFTCSMDHGVMSDLQSSARAARQLHENTKAEVHVVVLRNDEEGTNHHDLEGGGTTTGGDGNWITKAVRCREATSKQYGVVAIDVRVAILCEVMQWVDEQHKMMVGNTPGTGGGLLATSSVPTKGEKKRRKGRNNYEQEKYERSNQAVAPLDPHAGREERDDEWIVVERLGRQGRVLLKSSWQLTKSLWSLLDHSVRTISSCILMNLMNVKDLRIRAESGAHIVYDSFTFLWKSSQAWAMTILTSNKREHARQMRRSVLLDLGPASAPLQGHTTFIPWLLGLLGRRSLGEDDPLGQALFQGLKRASVAVALWSGPASAAPSYVLDNDTAPLVLIRHTGTRGHASARATAAEFAKKGYKCCIVEDCGDLSAQQDTHLLEGITVINTKHTTQKFWTRATLQLASGWSAEEVAGGIRRKMLDDIFTKL